ncbi:MAG: histidinol-phosphate transaminase [Proteobacteria bacterium]|nr:histidinol-phosphate transaminase [Pseudomonadota bacterium]
MQIDYHQLSHPGIQTLHPYVPGKSIEELQKEKNLKHIIKLASNENPLGCSPLALEALVAISPKQVASYPSPYNHPLQTKLAEKLGIDKDMLLLGNGSDTIYSVLLAAFALGKNKHMLTHQYAFSTYEIQAQTLGIPFFKTELNAHFAVDIDALIKATNEKTALIFIANPNNPTGYLIPDEEIEHLLANIPNTTILVLDEAYFEYVENSEDSLEKLKKYPNLVITRTFSKIYGLAGLRIGYAVANKSIASLLRKIQLPFVVNQAGMYAAMAALDDEAFLQQSLHTNKIGMEQMKKGLDALDVSYLTSHCNFLTIYCPNKALKIYEALLNEGVIVRPLHAYGLEDYLRVTIGKVDENSYFLDKLASCL